jgi:hypothetical protein
MRFGEIMVQRHRSLLVFGIVVAVVLGGGWLFRTHQQGQANLKTCGSLEPGGQRSELIQSLGAPRTTQANPAGTRLVLTFPGSLFPMKPIRAVVNVRDDVVMEVDCGDGRIKTYDKY